MGMTCCHCPHDSTRKPVITVAFSESLSHLFMNLELDKSPTPLKTVHTYLYVCVPLSPLSCLHPITHQCRICCWPFLPPTQSQPSSDEQKTPSLLRHFRARVHPSLARQERPWIGKVILGNLAWTFPYPSCFHSCTPCFACLQKSVVNIKHTFPYVKMLASFPSTVDVPFGQQRHLCKIEVKMIHFAESRTEAAS